MADKEIKKRKRKKYDLLRLCEKGLLIPVIEDYLMRCGDERFPNIAGFCTYCGIGQGEIEKLAEKYPDEYGVLYSVFEDAALNSKAPTSILRDYLGAYFGYGEDKKLEDPENPPKVVFLHDIFDDGL